MLLISREDGKRVSPDILGSDRCEDGAVAALECMR